MGKKLEEAQGWELVKARFEGTSEETQIKNFLKWVHESGKRLEELGKPLVKEYGQELTRQGWRSDTTQRSMTAVCRLWRALYEQGVTQSKPAEKKPNPAGWELAVRYQRQLKAEGHTKDAIEGMVGGVRWFLRYLETEGVAVREIDSEVVYQYQRFLLEGTSEKTGKPYHRRSIIRRMTALKNWLESLVKWGVLRDNPADCVKTLKQDKSLPQDLMKEEELEAYLEALGRWEEGRELRNQKYRYRAHVMAEVQYASGLRLSELMNLKDQDVDWDRGVIRVKQGKGGASRTAYLNQYALEVLTRWKMMRAVVLPPSDAQKVNLFGSGSALEHTYNGVLNQVAQGLGRRSWTSHKFRHCLGYHLLRSGCKLRSIQAILGHERIGTTEVYTKVDETDTRAVLDACHPRGRL